METKDKKTKSNGERKRLQFEIFFYNPYYLKIINVAAISIQNSFHRVNIFDVKKMKKLKKVVL